MPERVNRSMWETEGFQKESPKIILLNLNAPLLIQGLGRFFFLLVHIRMFYGHREDNPMNKIEWKETLEKASKELYKTLNVFGPSETLKLLLEFSRDDLVVRELLTMYPSIVSVGDFLFGRPTVQLDEETFRALINTNLEIWVRIKKDDPEGEHNICEKPSQKPKKPRSRKKESNLGLKWEESKGYLRLKKRFKENSCNKY